MYKVIIIASSYITAPYTRVLKGVTELPFIPSEDVFFKRGEEEFYTDKVTYDITEEKFIVSLVVRGGGMYKEFNNIDYEIPS